MGRIIGKKTKKYKKSKISKNRDIEEIVEQEETSLTMKDVVQQIDEIKEQKRKEFVNSLKQKTEEIEKKVEYHNKRVDAQEKDKKRQIDILKAISKVERQPSNEEIEQEREIQKFFKEVKIKTNEYIKNYDNERKKQSVKQQKTKKRDNKVSGTGNVFRSKEFKKLWEESQKQNESDSEER